MGYETKLIIGQSGHTMDESVYGDLIVEEGEAYRPMLKDEKGHYLKTGRKETYFMVIATINLCKCGSQSHIGKIDFTNKDESHFWQWYDGDERKTEDCYGDKPKPIPVSVVVDALRKDLEDEKYRRFKWALALLESMQDDKDITVLFYGH